MTWRDLSISPYTTAWIAAAGFKEVVVMASMPSTAGIAPGRGGC